MQLERPPRLQPRLRILHLEDSEDDHALVLAQLHRDGLRLDVTRVDTLAAFDAALAEPWDAIVCDYNLPGFTGLDVLAHLLASGRRRVLFAGDAQLPEVHLRREGWRQALHEAGLVAEPALELSVPFEPFAARARFDERCAAGVDFDAVVACSDLMAVQAVKALRAAGRHVPDDVAVVGYDDMPIASLSNPPVSSVHQPVPEAGKALVEGLLALLNGHAPAAATLPVHLVARRSSQAAEA